MQTKTIKQLIQVPENISTVIQIEDEAGIQWHDTAECGWPVLLALTEDENGETDVCPYASDLTGAWDFAPVIQFRPARYCKKCGQKMWIIPHQTENTLEYTCPSCDIR